MADNYKLVVIGESSVGKSSLVARFVSGAFSSDEPPTIGAAFYRCKLDLESRTVYFEIWDTAGQEQYSCLTPVYYRDADAALVVYDISKYDTFERARRWVNELRQTVSDDVIVFVVANKLDLEHQRTISCSEGRTFAEENGCFFAEVSALTGGNVESTFTLLASKLPIKKVYSSGDYDIPVNLPPKSGCSC
ncbi:hypothetical protein RCL1_008654 [Eukaryota sp. TZLM3-RCL]